MVKRIFEFLLGSLLFIAIMIFKEGANWFVESQDSGGKEMGAMAEWVYGVFLLLTSGIIAFKIFTYTFKLLRMDGTKSPINLLPIIVGFIVAPLIHKAYKTHKISKKVEQHILNHKLASEYVSNEFASYKDIYQIVSDSIDKWVADSLGVIIKEVRSSPNISVDSLIAVSYTHLTLPTIYSV